MLRIWRQHETLALVEHAETERFPLVRQKLLMEFNYLGNAIVSGHAVGAPIRDTITRARTGGTRLRADRLLFCVE